MDADGVLVIQSQRGDRAAFEELVRRTSRLVFARLYLETGDTHHAEDLAQETFLLAWRSIGQMTDPAGFRPWLLSIAHGAVIDAVRRESRKKRRGRRMDSEVLRRLPDPSPPPSDIAEAAEQRRRVLAILRSLPEQYRLPLMLRYLGETDYESISRQLALSNGSLRGLLQRGMILLRDEMSK